MDPIELAETIVIGDYETKNTLKQDVSINNGYLTGDFLNQPEVFLRWATLYELSAHEEIDLKNELARVYAREDYKARSEMKAAGIKATEKMVENTVITSANYVETLDKYHESKRKTALLKAAKDAMIHRRDMLIQLGATARAEGQQDIYIKEDAVKSIVGK